MIRRIGRKRWRLFAYDVESHNDEETVRKEQTSIWLSSFIDESSKPEDESCYFYDIESWLDMLDGMSRPCWKGKQRNVPNIMIYIYNLSFEWSFILPVLLKRGFTWNPKLEGDHVFSSVSTKSCSSVWEATIKFHEKSEVVFKDLMKILPGGLGKVAKSFGLPTQKGEIDYTLNRLHGHIVTPEEKLYCFKDTKIVMDILQIMESRDDREFFKSVSSSSYSCRKMIKVGYPHAYRPMKIFRKYYPELGPEESEFLRHTVAGGISYAPEAYQFKEIDQEIIHLDIHQAHPSSAYYHLYPKGIGVYFRGKPYMTSRICACHIKVSYSGVRLHSIISLIGTNIASGVEVWVWSFEIPTMKKCYIDLIIEWIDGYSYTAGWLPWRDYFFQNYQKRLKCIAKGDAFGKMYYKLLNNGAYGKFLEHGHDEQLENIIDEHGIIGSEPHHKQEWSINASFTYIPVGSCIPARTRVFLIESALKVGWKNVVYFDTDSIFFLKNKESLEGMKQIHISDKLGDWGLENEIAKAQFAAPKRYKLMERQSGVLIPVVHMAGVNFKGQKAPDFNTNIIKDKFTIQGVKRVRGGTIIVSKEKSIRVPGKYALIYDQNMQ